LISEILILITIALSLLKSEGEALLLRGRQGTATAGCWYNVTIEFCILLLILKLRLVALKLQTLEMGGETKEMSLRIKGIFAHLFCAAKHRKIAKDSFIKHPTFCKFLCRHPD
jgi:hypothetical protein